MNRRLYRAALLFSQEFNQLPEDARDDDEFKQELHQRVEDLSDALHDIATHRKNEAEKERDGITNDGWVVDHLGLLTNHYITLMQVRNMRWSPLSLSH